MMVAVSPHSSDYIVSSDHAMSSDGGVYSSTIPVVHEIKYHNVNNDRRLKKMVIRRFLDKATEWVANDYLDALTKYFKIVNKKIVLDSKIQKKDMSEDDKDKVVEHVLNYYIGKRVIAKVLYKLHHTKNINWYDMRKHKSKVRKELYKKIKKEILKSIKK